MEECRHYCRCGLWCRMWGKWYMYVVWSKSVYCYMWRISCSVRGDVCCIVKCCNCHILLAVDMAGVACQGLVCVCVCV